MAQVNHNVDYLNVVDGLTVWERLRVIRNFLNERKMALDLFILEEEEPEEMSEKEKKKQQIMKKYNSGLKQDCIDEIEFLTGLESKLAAEAEKTRIEGKTDREMYEINFFEESIQRILLVAKTEVLSQGRISRGTMETLLRNPASLDRAINDGILPKEVFSQIRNINNIPIVSFLGISNGTQLLEYKDNE